MTESKYIGTKGLTISTCVHRLEELFDKYKLNEQDDVYLQETLSFLKENIPELNKKSKFWDATEDLLTAKQWKNIFKELK